MVTSPGPSSAGIAAVYLLAEVSNGSDRNTELKQRQQQWEAGEVHHLVAGVLGQQHTGHQSRENKAMQQ